jgi:signal transduction histidine kinase
MNRILIVDDDPHAIKLYLVLLERAGFAVTVAINGTQMFAAIEKEKPDIILLDVILPDSNGLELCSEVKNNSAYSGIKILLISGIQVSASSIAHGIDIGADDYLKKPFDPQELLSRIKNLLKLKRVEEELRNNNKQLTRLSHHLQNIREEERKYLAGEVHEELGQLAAAVKIDIDWLTLTPKEEIKDTEKKRLSHASVASAKLISAIRKIAATLRPSMLDHLGLNASLEWLCKQFTDQNDVKCVFETACNDQNLDIKKKTELFRICQEALNNVTCDKATHVIVSLTEDPVNIYLNISDNGQACNLIEKKDTLGLIILRERALSINGELAIESAEGRGTRIQVVVGK